MHNTIAFTSPPFAAIEWRYENSDIELINNLTTHFLMDRGGSASLSGNLSLQPLSLFVNGANGNLHLDAAAGAAIDQAVSVVSGICEDDYDGQTRPEGAAGDIGADEQDGNSGNPTSLAGGQATRDTEGGGGCFIELSRIS